MEHWTDPSQIPDGWKDHLCPTKNDKYYDDAVAGDPAEVVSQGQVEDNPAGSGTPAGGVLASKVHKWKMPLSLQWLATLQR